MKLSRIQTDRAGGVLLGQAIGDALGVPYEFAPRIKEGSAQMIGGGLGPYKPGEWSDDTQMATCIASATALGFDLNTPAGLNVVARNFIHWQDRGATDIGAQTATVLRAARRGTGSVAQRMRRASDSLAKAEKAGNGALMRTGIVGLAELENPEATADAAREVAALTHANLRCQDACVLWSEAIRVAVVEGKLDIRAGLPYISKEGQAAWPRLIEEAETSVPAKFFRNGYVITAFQAAWSAIYHTQDAAEPVEAALQKAIAIGHDTDTVAAIAGSLLGARYGVSGLPTDLTRRVHGWPGLRARDLIRLAIATATWGWDDKWGEDPVADKYCTPLGIPHMGDPDVILGTEADLWRCTELGVTAVVSLSLVGDPDIAATGVAPQNHVTVWVLDSNNPRDNAQLAWTLRDAAYTVALLRDEGHRVLLHCRGAVHRTPSVALAYAEYCYDEVPQEVVEKYAVWGHAARALGYKSYELEPAFGRSTLLPPLPMTFKTARKSSPSSAHTASTRSSNVIHVTSDDIRYQEWQDRVYPDSDEDVALDLSAEDRDWDENYFQEDTKSGPTLWARNENGEWVEREWVERSDHTR